MEVSSEPYRLPPSWNSHLPNLFIEVYLDFAALTKFAPLRTVCQQGGLFKKRLLALKPICIEVELSELYVIHSCGWHRVRPHLPVGFPPIYTISDIRFLPHCHHFERQGPSFVADGGWAMNILWLWHHFIWCAFLDYIPWFLRFSPLHYFYNALFVLESWVYISSYRTFTILHNSCIARCCWGWCGCQYQRLGLFFRDATT